MVGRINAIKKVTLPRFLYLFRNLPPLFLTSKSFKQLDSSVVPFVWGSNSPTEAYGGGGDSAFLSLGIFTGQPMPGP